MNAITKIYGVFDQPADEIAEGFERISLVTDNQTGRGFFQVEDADGGFYLCDADGDKIDLSSWTMRRVLADVPADDSDAFFAAIDAAAKD